MKAIAATASLFLIAGACFAGPQPANKKSNFSFAEILTYNNISNQKIRCSPGPKVYALSQDYNYMNVPAMSTPVTGSSSNPESSQTFTPNPLVNSYKEFR